jgi:hypothetical protein
MKSRLFILLATSALLAASAAPLLAQSSNGPRCRFLGPGLVLKMSNYQQADGTYDSLADLTRDVNGTPCGIDCPAPSRVLWASAPTYDCSGR